jgi:biopolymer transport protein ExbB
VLQYIFDGGPMMLVLLALSVLAFAVIIDRLRAFRLAEQDADVLCEGLRASLTAGDCDGAEGVCKSTTGPAAAVALVGVKQYKQLLDAGASANHAESVSRVMTDYAPKVMDMLEKRLNYLSMVGSVAPLVGMTGTVVGMIASFDSMAAVGGLDGGAVAGGISMALVTTAAGLIVAIPAVIFHNVFSRRIERLTLDVEEAANAIINVIELKHTS